MVNIIYPSLVEQSYRIFQNQGISISKDQVYRVLIEEGMINQKGEPTKMAIKEGLVAVFNLEHSTIMEFKKEYSVFKKYDNDKFKHFENIWYISNDVAGDISDRLKKGNLSEDEVNQVSSYYSLRNYEKPKNIGEFKAINFPIYEDIPDESFQLIDGKFHFDVEAVRTLCNSVVNGEIDGNIEKAEFLLKELEG